MYSMRCFWLINKLARGIYSLAFGTTTCSLPSTATVQKYLHNPYEVYYVYIDGYRIEPPIRIRCTLPQYSDGFSAVYMEGFALPKITDEKIVRLTLEMIDNMVDIFREEGVNVRDPSDIQVGDLYLILASGQKMIPVLRLRHGNTVAWIGIDSEKIILLSFGVLSGAMNSNISDLGIRIDWDSILSNTTTSINYSEGGFNDLQVIVLLLALSVAILFVALYVKRYGFEKLI